MTFLFDNKKKLCYYLSSNKHAGDGTVKKTTNYDKFKYLLGNRDINQSHVRNLVKSISKNNLLEYNPILVDYSGFVIDGQHRLEAAKKLGVPVFYNQTDADIDTVILINNNSKNWSIEDFVNSYIEFGHTDYVALKEFKKKWGIPYTVSAAALSSQISDKKTVIGYTGEYSRKIKDGEFKVNPNNKADKIMQWVDSFTDYADTVIRRNRAFISAVAHVYAQKKVTLSTLKRKLRVCGKMLVRQNKKSEYLRQIEDIVNYKARKNIRLF